MDYFRSEERTTLPVDTFYNVLERGFDYVLPEYTLGLINSISKKVGAPTYIKTPVFKKNYMKKNNRRRRKAVEGDWDESNTFKTGSSGGGGSAVGDENVVETVVVKHEELILTSIKGIMNKLTEATYDDTRDSIFSSVKTLHEYIDTNGIDADDINTRLINDMLEIISQNKLYTKVYARLMKDFIDEFPVLRETYDTQMKERFVVFENVDISDDCDDYDKQCSVNNENEVRRCVACFMCEMMKVGVVDKEYVFHILNVFVELLDEKMSLEGNKELCNELSNIIETIVNLVIHEFKDHNGFKCIWEQLVEMSERTTKEYVSLTNKSLFKVLDIVEEYEDIMDE